MTKKSKMMMSAAVAGMVTGLMAPHAFAGEAAATTPTPTHKNGCSGKNGCNGTGGEKADAGAEKNSCSGKNGCNGTAK